MRTTDANRPPGVWKRTGAIVGVTVLALVIGGGSALANGQDSPPPPETHKVDICHATASETNPYTENSVSWSSVDNVYEIDWNGHGNHEGDIIPPFADFPGQNWDATGQAIYNNGCNPPPPPPVVVTPEVPTITDVCGIVNDKLNLPADTTSVVYTVEDTRENGVGEVIVEAVVEEGYIFPEGTTSEWYFEFTDEPCPVDPVVVTPEVPTATDVCDITNDKLNVPADTTSVVYEVDDQRVNGVGNVIVTAVAQEGYVFPENTVAEWTLTFTNEACPLPVPDKVQTEYGGELLSNGASGSNNGFPMGPLALAGIGALSLYGASRVRTSRR